MEYMKIISSLKPDLWTSLADEVPAWVSEKRNQMSVDRTVCWLDDCIGINLVCNLSTFLPSLECYCCFTCASHIQNMCNNFVKKEGIHLL